MAWLRKDYSIHREDYQARFRCAISPLLYSKRVEWLMLDRQPANALGQAESSAKGDLYRCYWFANS